MNEKYIHSTIIALLVIGLLMIGGGVYLLNNQVQMVAKSVKDLKGEMMEYQKPQPTSAVVAPTQTQMPVSHSVNVAGLNFDLPVTWSVESSEPNEAKLRVPDPKYHVVIAMSAYLVEKKNISQTREMLTSQSLLASADSGAKIYINGCGGALFCAIADYKGSLYEINFALPESDQPVPANLDGPWSPDTTVTRDQLISLLKTLR